MSTITRYVWLGSYSGSCVRDPLLHPTLKPQSLILETASHLLSALAASLFHNSISHRLLRSWRVTLALPFYLFDVFDVFDLCVSHGLAEHQLTLFYALSHRPYTFSFLPTHPQATESLVEVTEKSGLIRVLHSYMYPAQRSLGSSWSFFHSQPLTAFHFMT